MSQADDIKSLIRARSRRLQKLKEQEARDGYSVDPRILLEIEDLEVKLQELQAELEQLNVASTPLPAPNELPPPPLTSPIIPPGNEISQYYSCFISYSHKDEAFAERLYADLQQHDVPCWYAPQDMRIGDKMRPTIDRSIHAHDKLLLILSEHSINSDWVEKEVETAFEKEHQQKQIMLFPIRLDSTIMETDQAWAADIRRTRHIGNFSQWQDEAAYQKALERLLRDLKMEFSKS